MFYNPNAAATAGSRPAWSLLSANVDNLFFFLVTKLLLLLHYSHNSVTVLSRLIASVMDDNVIIIITLSPEKKRKGMTKWDANPGHLGCISKILTIEPALGNTYIGFQHVLVGEKRLTTRC